MTLRRRSYLAEATFNLNKDVDFIYEKSGLAGLVKAFKSKDSMDLWEALEAFARKRVVWKTDSSKFRSKAGRAAHKAKSIVLEVKLDRMSIYYPLENKIVITPNPNVFGILRDFRGHAEKAIKSVGSSGRRFASEMSEESIKGTIYHELSHWADDALHGGHIEKSIQVAKEASKKEPGPVTLLRGRYKNYASVNHTPIEINAQVHAIKLLRAHLGKRAFDKMTWDKMFEIKPSLAGNFRGFVDEGNYKSVMKKFMSRLHREGLLGRALKKVPSYREMKELV